MTYLEDAMDLDIHLVSDYPECNQLAEILFQEICERIDVRNKPRSIETLKLLVINLWLSYRNNRSLKYSRNRNDYLHPKRYGKLHIKYKRLIPVVDVLRDLGYLDQKIGFFDRDNKIGRQSRIFPTEKLIGCFKDYLPEDKIIVRKTQPEEIIHLKNDVKNLMDYRDTRSVRDMRANLRRYNEFIASQRIDICAPPYTMVNFRFLLRLRLNLLKGVIDFNDFKTTGESPQESSSPDYRNEDDLILLSMFPMMFANTSGILPTPSELIVTGESESYDSEGYSSYPISVAVHDDAVVDLIINTPTPHHNQYNLHYITYTITSTMTKTLREISDKKTRNFRLLEKRQIADFGINGLYFQSRYQYLHRVFNNETFRLGGRFYGAFHLGLPKELRPHIRINNNPSVELDYSALHIRMLYHLKNIDYKEDPYSALCENEADRKVYKLVQLISINSKTEDDAIRAIRDELRKKCIQFDLTNKSISRCIGKFRKCHSPIANNLNTSIGLKLQNLDSRITERILKVMTQNGIPCLPVHDSYIVPADFKDFLFDVMSESYQQVMRYMPVIK